MPLDEANKLIEANVKILDTQTALDVCGVRVKPMQSVATNHPYVKPREIKPKVTSLRGRMGKIMHKLYDLEADNTPEKPLNVDFGVKLYQMEDY